jgi:hypothetical protein
MKITKKQKETKLHLLFLYLPNDPSALPGSHSRLAISFLHFDRHQ